MSFLSKPRNNSLSSQPSALIQPSSSIIIPAITSNDFYLDLITIILQLSKQTGLSQQQLLSLHRHFIQAKGIKNNNSQYYPQSTYLSQSQSFNNHNSFNLISKLLNPKEISSLISKIQTELSYNRQKQFQFFALKNFVTKKSGQLTTASSTCQDSKVSRFNSMILTEHQVKKQTKESKGNLQIEQILMSIPKQQNQSHEILRRIKKLKTMFGHRFEEQFQEYCQIFNCIFDMTQKLIISAGQDGLIKIWSRQTGHLLSNLKGHQSYIIKIIVSKCNKYLISTASDGIRFFDLNTLKTLGCWISASIIDVVTSYEDQKNKQEMRIVFSESKRLMLLKEQVMLQRAQSFEILTLKDFKCFSLEHLNKRQNNNVSQIVLNEKNILLLGFQSGLIVMSKYNQLLLLQDVQDQNEPHLLPFLHVFNGHKAQLMQIKWNSTCQELITGCKEGLCKIWEFKRQEEKPSIIHQFRISKLSPRRKKKQFTCNYLAWNCTQTHIIASFHQIPTEEDEQDQQRSRGQGQILIYQVANKFIVQLSRQFANVVNLASITSIDLHPIFPNILLFCDKTGKIFLVDIFLKTIINIFEERGYHLQHPQFRLIPTQCHFSKDGTYFILSTQYGTISIYGYDINDFYKIAPDEQFLKTDYLPFRIHTQTLRPIVSGLSQQLQDINQIPRGQVCNMLGAPYKGMLACDYITYKENIDKQMKNTIQTIINSNENDKQNSQDISNQSIDQKQIDNKEQLKEIETNKKKQKQNNNTILSKDFSSQNLQKFLEQLEVKNQNTYEISNDFFEKIKLRTQQYQKREEVFKSINNQLKHNHNTIINGQNSKFHQNIKIQINQKINYLKKFYPQHFKMCQENLNKKQQFDEQHINSYNSYKMHKKDNLNPEKHSKRSRNRSTRRLRLNYQEDQSCFDKDEQEFQQQQEQQYQSSSEYPIRDNYNYISQSQNSNQRISNRPLRTSTRNTKNYYKEYQKSDSERQNYSQQQKNNKRGRLRGNNSVKPINIQIEEYNEGNYQIKQQDKDQQFYKNSRTRKIIKQNQKLLQDNVVQIQNDEKCNRCMKQKANYYCYYCKIKGFCAFCKNLRGKQNPFICFNCIFKTNRSHLEKKKVSEQYFRQTQRKNSCYIPQIGDQVYFFFQGYQQFISKNILHLNNSILETRIQSNFNILPHQQNRKLWINTPLCRVKNYQYLFPLKQPRSHLYSGINGISRSHQQQKINHIQMIIKLQILDSILNNQEESIQQNKQFEIFFIPQYDFIVRKQICEEAIQLLKKNKYSLNQIIKDNENQQLQIIQICPYDDHFLKSYWNYIKARKTQGKRLRTNKSNQKRVNLWNVNYDQYFSKIQFNSSLTSQSDLIQLEITKIFEQEVEQYSLFFDYVDIQVYPKYRQSIEVGMCLKAIQQRIKNKYYRCIQSLKKDIQMIELNSVIFNGEQNDITLSAKKLTKRLLNVIGLQPSIRISIKTSNVKKINQIQKMDQEPTIQKKIRKLNIVDSDQQQEKQKKQVSKIRKNGKIKDQSSQDYRNQRQSQDQEGENQIQFQYSKNQKKRRSSQLAKDQENYSKRRRSQRKTKTPSYSYKQQQTIGNLLKNSKSMQNNNRIELRRRITRNKSMVLDQQKIQDQSDKNQLNIQSKPNQNQHNINTRRSSRLQSSIRQQQNKDAQVRFNRRKLRN